MTVSKMKFNRVNPSGALSDAPSGARALMMGNRGILQPRHFELSKPYAIKTWIACVLNDKAGKPLPKVDVKYTRLFLLDEVTAFAAGHRPCGQCQRRRYLEFVEFWTKANRKEAKVLDDELHRERLAQYEAGGQAKFLLSELPYGTMVKFGVSGQPHLWLWGKLLPWTVSGYLAPICVAHSETVEVLTPPSILKTFMAGFPLPLNSSTTVHPSALSVLPI